MKKIAWSIALFMSFGFAASAQTTLIPGHKSISYKDIRPFLINEKVTISDSTGKILREFQKTDEVVIDKKANLLYRIQKSDFGSGRILLDSTVADLKTLTPVRMRMVTTPNFKTMDLLFSEKFVDAREHSAGKDSVHVKHEMPEAYFDSNLYEWVLTLLPYTKGYQAKINTYTFERSGLDVYTVKNAVEDTLTINGKQVACWKLSIDGTAGEESEYWINRKEKSFEKCIIKTKGTRLTYTISKI